MIAKTRNITMRLLAIRAASPVHTLTSIVPVCIFLLCFAVSARSQVAPTAPTTVPSPLTLNQAIAIALQHQPQQYIAKDQVSQAKGQSQQAKSQYYPTVTPTYQFQDHSQTFYDVNRTPAIGGVANTRSNVTTITRGGGLSISLDQTLYDAGNRETANAQARRAQDAAGFNNLNVRQDTILSVTQDYYDLLAALDLVKVAQSQVARYQETYDATQAQIAAGTTAKKEAYQAEADLANAQVTLLQNQNQVVISSAALKNIMGVSTNAVVAPSPLAAGDNLPPLPAGGAEPSLDVVLATAYASRPDLRQQQASVESDNAALSQAKRNAGFTVRSDYVLTYQAMNDLGSRGTDSQLLVTGSYPLFDAGNARGAVRIAQAEKDVAENQLESLRQQIHQDVEQAYATRAVSIQAAKLAQSAVTAGEVNYQAAIESRRAGIGTVLDVTTAQVTLTQAQNQFVSAVYNFYIADAQLRRAIGRNDSAPATTP